MPLLLPTRTALLPLLLASLILPACSGGEGETADGGTPAPTAQERDSALAEMPLPGAQGIRGALDASSAAGARAEAHDTIR